MPGVFGDIFDVIFAYPDVDKWRTIDTYPVVIAAGDIELTAAEGAAAGAVRATGGTLLVADGASDRLRAWRHCRLPACAEPAEASGYRWLDDAAGLPSQRFRYRAIVPGDAAMRELATTPDGQCICAALDRGAGG